MDIEYGTDHAVVTLVSEIADETVIELAATMRHLRDDCFYDRVHLEIASLGGSETTLNYWLDEAVDLREHGLRIATRGLTSVGSAAAVILSLGGAGRPHRPTRTACRDTWAMGKSTSARRLHCFGIMRRYVLDYCNRKFSRRYTSKSVAALSNLP